MARDPDYTPFGNAPPQKTIPRESLWSFRKDDVQWACELLVHGDYGVEAQILRDGELFISRRFDLRAVAVRWANEQRQLIERGASGVGLYPIGWLAR